MDLLSYLDNIKLLISSEFKYFTTNSKNEIELKDGHFLRGLEFLANVTNNKLCFLKVDDLDLKFHDNKLILTGDRDIGSHVILEPFDDISFYLKHFEGYFNKNFELVPKEEAFKVQALWVYNGDILDLPTSIPIANTGNNEESSIISIEGIKILLNTQKFQIILHGHSYDYANQFDEQFFFSSETFRDGDKFELVSVNNKLTLYNPLFGYLGKGKNEHGHDCVMYSMEIPDKLVYLIPYRDPGMYVLKCSENEFVFIDWVKSSCGFSDFTESIDQASIFQFMLDYSTNSKDST